MKKIVASKLLTGQGYCYSLHTADTFKNGGEPLTEVFLSQMEITGAKDAQALLTEKFGGNVDFDNEQVELYVAPETGELVKIGIYGRNPVEAREFDQYQIATSETAIYKDKTKSQQENLYYVTLGLVGEAGEIANKAKKVIRDHGGVVTPEYREALIGELGDVLWYAAQLASTLEITLSEVAKRNLEKLFSRKDRGTLAGDGDSR